jgi:iron(III) transport system permease protein
MSFLNTVVGGLTRYLPGIKEVDARSSSPLPTLTLPRWTSLILPMFITGLVLIPISYLVAEILTPDVEMWQRIWNTVLPRSLGNTLMIVAGVGIGTTVIGAGFAWLVTAYEFPGRKWFERLFLLPLAIPGFIMGFTFVAIFEYAGPVQTFIRDNTGNDTAGWFPSINSIWGLILVLTLVLYPYVYLLARAAFREQGASTFEAARVMGMSRWGAFRRLVLPLARPSIAAGALLAMMEAMTDYGTVSFFGIPTLSERVVVLWNAEFNSGPAFELASMLLFIGLAFMLLERMMRGKARYYQQGVRGRRLQRHRLQGRSAWMASGASFTLLFVAFILPVSQLVLWVLNEIQYPSTQVDAATYLELAQNSLQLGLIAAGFVVTLALIVAYGVRQTSLTSKRRLPRLLSRFVTLGYAMPGAVIAAGVLAFVNPIDARVTDFVAEHVDLGDTVYLLTGTIIALIYAYIVRFMAVGFSSVESSMEKVTPNMEGAARTLGAGPGRVLRRVHLPLVSAGAIAGAILVFVDVMKELPATFLLRPHGLRTLATEAYLISKEGIWDGAAIYGLTILVVGIIPVLFLMRIGEDQRDRDTDSAC